MTYDDQETPSRMQLEGIAALLIIAILVIGGVVWVSQPNDDASTASNASHGAVGQSTAGSDAPGQSGGRGYR